MPSGALPKLVRTTNPDAHAFAHEGPGAIDFGPVGPVGTVLTVIGPQLEGRLFVFNPVTENYGWVNLTDTVAVDGPPAPTPVVTTPTRTASTSATTVPTVPTVSVPSTARTRSADARVFSNPTAAAIDFGPVGPIGTVLTEGIRSAMEADLERHLMRARDQSASKGWGNLPAEIRTELEAVAKRRKPQVDWKRTLRLFASSGYRTEVVATQRRMSKRFGTFPGIRIKRKQRLAVVIDTSGSIDEDVLEVFFREIHGIWKNDAEVIVIECDADIQGTYPYKGKTPSTIKGGGGTSFDPAFSWINNTRNGSFDACIYLTDGCASEPVVKPRSPLLWVITANGKTGDHLKFGRIIQLPKD